MKKKRGLRTFQERMKAAKGEFKTVYRESPDYIDQYWFALSGRRPSAMERKLIEEAGLIGKDEKLPSEKERPNGLPTLSRTDR